MANDGSPTVRHRRLTQLLRRLREDSGLIREEVARAMEWHGSKVSKIETGQWKRLQPRDVRGLLEIYGVTDRAEQDTYVQLARDGEHQDVRTALRSRLAADRGLRPSAVPVQPGQRRG